MDKYLNSCTSILHQQHIFLLLDRLAPQGSSFGVVRQVHVGHHLFKLSLHLMGRRDNSNTSVMAIDTQAMPKYQHVFLCTKLEVIVK